MTIVFMVTGWFELEQDPENYRVCYPASQSTLNWNQNQNGRRQEKIVPSAKPTWISWSSVWNIFWAWCFRKSENMQSHIWRYYYSRIPQIRLVSFLQLNFELFWWLQEHESVANWGGGCEFAISIDKKINFRLIPTLELN